MVQKKKKKAKEAPEKKVRSYLNYKVFEDSTASCEAHVNDKEMVALILILFKQLDESARKVVMSIIKVFDLIDRE